MTTGDNGTWTDAEWGPFHEVYNKSCAIWKEVGLTGVKMLLNPWEIAPLPGFVRTRSLEERLSYARQYGLITVIAPAPPNHRWDPEWLPWECQEDYQGLTHWSKEPWNCQHFPDHSNPIYRDLVRRILVGVYDHIKDDMDIVAWNYQTDIFFVDHGGGFAGYSVSSQEAFRRFLREKLALSLKQVNERYGSEHLQQHARLGQRGDAVRNQSNGGARQVKHITWDGHQRHGSFSGNQYLRSRNSSFRSGRIASVGRFGRCHGHLLAHLVRQRMRYAGRHYSSALVESPPSLPYN